MHETHGHVKATEGSRLLVPRPVTASQCKHSLLVTQDPRTQDWMPSGSIVPKSSPMNRLPLLSGPTVLLRYFPRAHHFERLMIKAVLARRASQKRTSSAGEG
jgi:hypothetical protein